MIRVYIEFYIDSFVFEAWAWAYCVNYSFQGVTASRHKRSWSLSFTTFYRFWSFASTFYQRCRQFLTIYKLFSTRKVQKQWTVRNVGRSETSILYKMNDLKRFQNHASKSKESLYINFDQKIENTTRYQERSSQLIGDKCMSFTWEFKS